MRMGVSARIVVGVTAALFVGGASWNARATTLGAGAPGESVVVDGAATVGDGGGATSVSLNEAIGRVLHCGAEGTVGGEVCAGVVYFWSPAMPLSRRGIDEIQRATDQLGLDLAVVDASDFEPYVESLGTSNSSGSRRSPAPSSEDALVAEMLASGATLHYPSLLVHSSGELVGPAILGYKTAEAYRAMIGQRLYNGFVAPHPGWDGPRLAPADSLVWSKDFPVSGRPGAYFRSVPGRQSLAFESRTTIYLLDLNDGSAAVAPGQVDFVPTPDGRFFVTPADFPGGLAFYDAEEVYRAARAGRGSSVQPIYVDPRLRDQYPSVGILRSERDGDGTRTVYRVLTSWYDRIAFRDYEVQTDASGRRVDVRPLADRVTACPQVSIPILSPDGREVAGRDETSATTKIFRLSDDGECQEVEDLRLQTGKVAWTPDSGKVAFAIPRGAVSDGSGTIWVAPDQPELAGIFVYDRTGGKATLVPGSEEVDRLAFPEFVGSDSLVFVLRGGSRGAGSVFRLVCCIQ